MLQLSPDCQPIRTISRACYSHSTDDAYVRVCESQLPVASPSFMQETATMMRISVVRVYIRRIVCIISV